MSRQRRRHRTPRQHSRRCSDVVWLKDVYTFKNMNLCALDEQRFRYCCQLLLQQSQQLKDGWSWEAVQGSEEGYLKKTTVRSVVIDSRPMWDHESSRTSTSDQENQQEHKCETEDLSTQVDGDDEDDDGLCAPCGSCNRVLQYEYHVMYSCSYGTPVLYFRVSSLEGRSLSLDDVWRSVHPSFRPRLQKNPLGTISLQEHPLLGQPFFMLHPCRTEEFMRPVLQDQQRPVNYVLVWLSVVGPLVGLDVPLKYSTQLHLPACCFSTSNDWAQVGR